MYYGEDFINMIRRFYPDAKSASGGKELVVRCGFCGDSENPHHSHLYISVPQSPEELSQYHCKKCNAHGIVDDIFLRKYGCTDSKALVDIVQHNSQVLKLPGYARFKNIDIYPLKNECVSDYPWNQQKIAYINQRIGSNFSISDLLSVKVFLNLYDILNQNRLKGTRDPRVLEALNKNFIGFISYDNSYAILRKCTEEQLHPSINKRYVNYHIVNKMDDSKDFYVLPTTINIEDPTPVKIHIAEGVFDILSIWYNLRYRNIRQELFVAAAGKSYVQALGFILKETGIINYEIHFYPDADVRDDYFQYMVLNKVALLPSDIYVHRNICNGEKDYGVPGNRVIDSTRKIMEMII